MVFDNLEVRHKAFGDGVVIAAKALAYQMYLGEEQGTYVEVIYSGTDEFIYSFSLPMSLIGQ